MIGKFYGISGVMLAFAPINKQRFSKMVKSLDTKVNRPILKGLEEDLKSVIDCLESLPKVYLDPNDQRAAIRLQFNRYKDEDEKAELEKQIEGKETQIPQTIPVSGNNVVKLSDGAFAVLNYINSNLDKLKEFKAKIVFSGEDSDVIVLGEKLYLMNSRWNRGSLNRRLAELYKTKNKTRMSESQLNTLKSELGILKSYIVDEENPMEDHKSLIYDELKAVENLMGRMSVDGINSILNLSLTEDDYYKITFELAGLGLVGFTVYCSEFLENFKQSVSFSGVPDTNIYKGSPLYEFTKDLELVINSIDFISGRGKNE